MTLQERLAKIEVSYQQLSEKEELTVKSLREIQEEKIRIQGEHRLIQEMLKETQVPVAPVAPVTPVVEQSK